MAVFSSKKSEAATEKPSKDVYINDYEKSYEKNYEEPRSSDVSIGFGEDVLAGQNADAALHAKMHIVNDAIDSIGWTNYHTKLFFLNGFGYAVDSLTLLLQSVVASHAAYEFNPSYPLALDVAVYVGMFTGALFWGFSADVIGRRFAFNVSLFISSVFCVAAGGAPNWVGLASFIALVGFGAGGNLVLDTTVFLEYLPSHKQWVLTFLACWWGFGQFITGVFAWGFYSNPSFNCTSNVGCTKADNMGWRYVMYSSGALVFVMSILRVTIVRLKETPKFLLGEGREEQLVNDFHEMGKKYNRPCSITLSQLQACGTIQSAHGKSKASVSEFTAHMRGLFSSKKQGWTTALIWTSWALIGLAYPVFYVFLSTYLASRGADFGNLSIYETWRNYALVNICGIPGPMLAGWMANQRALGRRYTMAIGAIATMAFFFGYTQIKNENENIALSCMIGFTLNIYYATLYAYTPEVLPSAHRATGNGIAVAFNRFMGIMAAIIQTYADPTTSIPIFLCGALYVVMAAIAVAFPFEPYGKRSS